MKNNTLSMFKFIAAVAVVLIHASSFLYHQDKANFFNYFWYRPILNFAVPFFFSASGYVLSIKDISYFKIYLKKLVFIYTMYSILYFIINLLINLGTNILSGDTLRQSFIIFLKEKSFIDILNGTIGFYPLWYLWSLLIATFIMYISLKKLVPIKTMLFSSILVFIISTFFRNYPIINDVLYEGGFIKALSFLIIGYYVGTKKILVNKPLLKSLIILVLYVVSFQFLKFNIIIDFLFIPIIFYLMIYIVNNHKSDSLLSSLGEYSSQVYLHHMFFILGYKIATTIFPYFIISNSFFRIIIVTFLSVVLSIALKNPVQKYYLDPVKKYFSLKI